MKKKMYLLTSKTKLYKCVKFLIFNLNVNNGIIANIFTEDTFTSSIVHSKYY